MLLFGTFLLVSSFSISNGQFIVEILQPATSRGMRHPVERCDATGANFGDDVASFSFSPNAVGCPVSVSPELACSNVTYDPFINGTTGACINLFAVVPRGQCNFSEKAFHVQQAQPHGLSAIIVFNDKGKAPVDMNGGRYKDDVRIPILMVSYDCMQSMMEKYPPSSGYLVQIKISPGYYDLFRYLIPFIVVVGFCFLVLLISLAIRLCRERRRIARKRLSKRNLRKIPTKKFRKGDYPETCAICLEDFIEGEKLRVLPCRHTYHCLCIDPWLTQNRKVCPMCKRRVGAKNSDSESSDEERHRHDMPSTSGTQEQTPVNVSEIDEQGNPNFDAPENTSMSNVLVQVHHNSHMGSQEQLVDEDFLAHMTNHESEDEAEPQESLSQSFRRKLKTIFNRSGHSPLQEEEDFSQDNAAFHGSTPSVSDGQPTVSAAPAAAEPAPEGSNSSLSNQFRDPFEHRDEPPAPSAESVDHPVL